MNRNWQGFVPERLDFNLTSTGLSLTGKTNSASELLAFIGKLNILVAHLPASAIEAPTGGETPLGGSTEGESAAPEGGGAQ